MFRGFGGRAVIFAALLCACGGSGSGRGTDAGPVAGGGGSVGGTDAGPVAGGGSGGGGASAGSGGGGGGSADGGRDGSGQGRDAGPGGSSGGGDAGPEGGGGSGGQDMDASAGGSGGQDAAAGPEVGRFPPQILTFSPTAGAVGTTVLIQGISFGDTPAENTVRFNGVVAVVQSATATEIVVLVPPGATTGPITVTTAAGTGRTSRSFIVLADATTPGVAWTTRLQGPRGRVSGLAWNGSLLVTVGNSIQTSSDVLRWDERMTLVSLNDVAWDGRLFAAVGGSLFAYSSQTGLTWTRSTTVAGNLGAVAGSGTTWVGVGGAGMIRTSVDGLTWTSVSSPTTKDLRDVAWTGSQFVVVGREGIILTSPDGAAWTVRPGGTIEDFTAVGATSSLMVATTSPSFTSPSVLLTSPDGGTWTERARALPSGNSITYAAGRWVVAGDTKIVTSTDGVSWSVSSSNVGILPSVVHTGAEYVAVGWLGGSVAGVYTSPDAQQWALRSYAQRLTTVARSSADGRLAAIGLSEVTLASTDNGATWQFGGTLNDSISSVFLDVAWFPPANAFVALVGEGANQRIYTSVDGVSWTRRGDAPYYGALGASPSLIVNVGATVVGRGLATSSDGVTWTPRIIPTTLALEDVFWTGSQFIAVGSSGTIITSPDGVTWTQRTSGTTVALLGVAASPLVTVVVGASGTILSSPDGVVWDSRTSGSRTLRRVAWTGNEFVAVGGSGTAVRSVDGVSWTVQPTPFSDVLFGSEPFNLNDAVWTGPGARLVVVGTRGLVATSP